MANNYPPYSLEKKVVLGDGVIITWEIHNAIEFRKDVRYNVYTSPDGNVYSLLKTVVRREASIPLTSSNSFIRVSSVVPVLGESSQSVAYRIKGPMTTSSPEASIVVAVDSAGEPRFLKTDDGGRLVVSADVKLAELKTTIETVLAKEASQQEIVAEIVETKASLGLQLSKEFKQDLMIDLLSELKANSQAGQLKINESTMDSVGTIGQKITFGFYKRAIIHQITAIHEFGSASNFVVRIWCKKGSSSERDILAKFYSYGETRLDVVKTISYINMDELDEITLEIIPDLGTSNDFFIRVSGSLAL